MSASPSPVAAPAAHPSSDDVWPRVWAITALREFGGRRDGVFTDAANDHGGPTKYGLSLRFLAAAAAQDSALRAKLDADHNGRIDGLDVKALTYEAAESIYRAAFWVDTHLRDLPMPFSAAVFDQAVNGGLGAAVRMMQKALNGVWRLALNLEPLAVDGALGQATRARLAMTIAKGRGIDALLAYRDEAVRRYRGIVIADPAQTQWLNGWLKRAGELGDV